MILAFLIFYAVTAVTFAVIVIPWRLRSALREEDIEPEMRRKLMEVMVQPATLSTCGILWPVILAIGIIKSIRNQL